jgi:flagellar biosynthesis protein FliR
MPVSLAIDPAWAIGLVLAITRAAGFVVAAPTVSRAVPVPARMALVLTFGLFLTRPVTEVATLPELIGAGVVNAAMGAVLGFLTGLLFHVFTSAGALIDLSANLSVASVFDPTQGEQSAVVGRMFNLIGLALFVVAGGLGLLAAVLYWSVEAVPLGGIPRFDSDLAAFTISGTSRMMVVAAELALPVLGPLFLIEVALGVAARLAPQANVFLLGLPAKLLAAFALLGVSAALLPEATDGYTRFVTDTARAVLASMGGG